MSASSNSSSYPVSVSAICLPTFAIIATVLCLPLLLTHIQSGNLAASVLIFWIVLENLFNLINPIIWPTDDISSWWNGVGLCDIEVKLELAADIAFIGALVGIYRQLAIILDADKNFLIPTRQLRRRRSIIEISLCFGLPIYIMVAHFLVQPSRYYIYSISGCLPSFDNSWPTIVLIFLLPVILWTIAALYCALVVYRLIRYRRQFSGILTSSHSTITKSQFLRLFAMATTLIVAFLPVALYIFVRNLEYPRHAYSWNAVHSSTLKDRIIMVPSQGSVTFDRWIQVITGYVVFLFFGFSRDGRKKYRNWCILIGLGRIFPKLHESTTPTQPTTLPSSASPSPSSRLGSLSSQARLIFNKGTSQRNVSSV